MPVLICSVFPGFPGELASAPSGGLPTFAVTRTAVRSGIFGYHVVGTAPSDQLNGLVLGGSVAR
ncbi:MAG: hypothetical protein AAFO58_10875, partial [Pseudomonadota bacterium]